MGTEWPKWRSCRPQRKRVQVRVLVVEKSSDGICRPKYLSHLSLSYVIIMFDCCFRLILSYGIVLSDLALLYIGLAA